MLADAIAKAHALNEQKIAAGVQRVSSQLDADELQHLSSFNRFCSLNGLRNVPAAPQVIAAFIRSEKDTEPHKIVLTLAAIERLHDFRGLANPVATAVVRAELERILKIEPPRSWPKIDQLIFAALPPEIRAIIARRERQRESELRRCQNAAAEAKQRAEQLADTSNKDETKNHDDQKKR